MNNFTLKVIYNKTTGLITPDKRHEFGGTDLIQVEAFHHICPSGISEYGSDSLYEMARLHGWDVKTTIVQD